jgi:hypothetical protein
MMRNVRIFFLLLGLPFYIWLYHNQITNWHYHVTDNGSLVKHAHPYKNNTIPGTPFQKHHHSSFEFLFLSLVYNAIPLLVTLLVLGLVLRNEARYIAFNFATLNLPHGFYRTLQLRGPPCRM